MESETKDELGEEKPRGNVWTRLRELVPRLNVPFLIAAGITALVAASSDAWWSVRSTGSDSILQVSVSPFFVRILALNVPSTVPNADFSGLFVRVGLGFAAAALAWQGFFPLSVWRKPVLWLSLSVIAAAFLNFVLLVHSTQLVLLQQYGIVPSLTGDTVIPGLVVGTDLVAYANPTVSSSLGLGLVGGIAGFILLGGAELAQYVFLPRLSLGLPGSETGLTGAFLSPPYQHAWLTTNDEGMNPLGQDPDKLSDEELALSFDRLLKALQPGAKVSVILPPWATKLSNRLSRVVSWTGFELENSQVIFRAPGRPENELVFRKPTPEKPETDLGSDSEQEDQAAEAEERPDWPHRVHQRESESDLGNAVTDDGLSNVLDQPGRPLEVEAPPVEEQVEDPVWAQPAMDPQESEIISAAVKLIEETGEPIPYRELITHVYLDMVNRNVGFESGNQIEIVLLQHVGKELSVYEHLDETGANVERSWWLGETATAPENKPRTSFREKLKRIENRAKRMKGILQKKTEGDSKPMLDREDSGEDKDNVSGEIEDQTSGVSEDPDSPDY